MVLLGVLPTGAPGCALGTSTPPRSICGTKHHVVDANEMSKTPFCNLFCNNTHTAKFVLLHVQCQWNNAKYK
jgi:hypothetical protein